MSRVVSCGCEWEASVAAVTVVLRKRFWLWLLLMVVGYAAWNILFLLPIYFKSNASLGIDCGVLVFSVLLHLPLLSVYCLTNLITISSVSPSSNNIQLFGSSGLQRQQLDNIIRRTLSSFLFSTITGGFCGWYQFFAIEQFQHQHQLTSITRSFMLLLSNNSDVNQTVPIILASILSVWMFTTVVCDLQAFGRPQEHWWRQQSRRSSRCDRWAQWLLGDAWSGPTADAAEASGLLLHCPPRAHPPALTRSAATLVLGSARLSVALAARLAVGVALLCLVGRGIIAARCASLCLLYDISSSEIAPTVAACSSAAKCDWVRSGLQSVAAVVALLGQSLVLALCADFCVAAMAALAIIWPLCTAYSALCFLLLHPVDFCKLQQAQLRTHGRRPRDGAGVEVGEGEDLLLGALQMLVRAKAQVGGQGNPAVRAKPTSARGQGKSDLVDVTDSLLLAAGAWGGLGGLGGLGSLVGEPGGSVLPVALLTRSLVLQDLNRLVRTTGGTGGRRQALFSPPRWHCIATALCALIDDASQQVMSVRSL